MRRMRLLGRSRSRTPHARAQAPSIERPQSADCGPRPAPALEPPRQQPAAAADAWARERYGSAKRSGRRLRPAAASDLDVTEALLASIGAGDSSVAQVAKLAGTLAGRLGDPTLLQLAGMRERDLHNWCAKQPWRQSLPEELYAFSMQKFAAARSRDCGTAMAVAMHYCILPHELFASVAAYSAELWQFLFGNAAELKEWWQSAAERAPSTADGGPWCTAAADCISGLGHCVPIGIHGDDAGGHANEKVTVVTWGSVAVARSTLDSRFVFTMLKGSDAPAEAGLRSILRVLAWSLNALAEGTWPAADESGRPFDANHHPGRAKLAGRPLVQPAVLAGPDAAVATACPGAALPAAAGGDAASVVKGIWSEMRGDWKFLKEALGLKRNYGVNGEMCHRCRAHNGRGRGRLDDNLLYTNFGREDHVRTTREDPATWFEAAAAAPNPSPLLGIRGFSIDRVFFDIMHCMDLGVFQHAVASALAELTGAAPGFQAVSIFPGADLNARLAAATVHYRTWCRNRRLERRAPKFNQRWVKGPWPEVSQLQAKAAEMRTNLVPWFADVCAAVAAEHGDHGHVRAEMFSAFVRIDEACRGSSRFLAAAAAEKLEFNMERALKLYNALAAEAVECGRALWRLRPKLHACTHIGFEHGGTNPRWVHCYADEDMVGRMKRLYKKCHGATAPWRALQRYMIMVGLRWAHSAAEAAQNRCTNGG